MASDAFSDRESAFEGKDALDSAAGFRLNARAAKLFGLWAASQMGMSGYAASAYADSILDTDIRQHGVRDCIRKVKADFAKRGTEMTEHHLENQFKVHVAEARKELG